MIPATALASLPPMVAQALSQMDSTTQQTFYAAYADRSKSAFVAYLTWLVGCHYIYAGKVGMFFAFFFTGGGLFIWAFVDLFRIPGIIRRYNEDVAIQLLTQFKQLNA